MALISAKTIITSLCLFHITLGFFFLTNPASLADQAVVDVIGEAMGMVSSPLPPLSSLLLTSTDLFLSPPTDPSTSAPRHWPS